MISLRNTALVLCICSAVLFAGTKVVSENIMALKSPDLKNREKAAELIGKNRSELVEQLIELAAEPVEPVELPDARFPAQYPWHDAKHLATLLLGDLRAAEAVTVLLQNLEYNNPKTQHTFEPMDKNGWYPAVDSLSKIGMPAVGPTIKKLGGYEKDCLGRELCSWVVKKVLGLPLAKVRMEIAIEETRDAKVKDSLRAALGKYFKTLKEIQAAKEAKRKKTGSQER